MAYTVAYMQAQPVSGRRGPGEGSVYQRADGRWFGLIAHGTERQGTWAPGIAPTIWSDLGPA